jgi:hypothetical protein
MVSLWKMKWLFRDGNCGDQSASLMDSRQGLAAEKRVHYQRFHAKLTL